MYFGAKSVYPCQSIFIHSETSALPIWDENPLRQEESMTPKQHKKQYYKLRLQSGTKTVIFVW